MMLVVFAEQEANTDNASPVCVQTGEYLRPCCGYCGAIDGLMVFVAVCDHNCGPYNKIATCQWIPHSVRTDVSNP